MEIDQEEWGQLVRDKYGSEDAAPLGALDADRERLTSGEPLAYVVGWMPFLGLRIDLSSRPLIPRPETEWWTEELIAAIKKEFGDKPFTFLDLCAGSGAIGLAILSAFQNVQVSFGEIGSAHIDQIRRNLETNSLDATRARIRRGDLFTPFYQERFDIIATNPPYVPAGRELDASVTEHEPSEALYAGWDGLELIRRIAAEAKAHLRPGGALWMECDIENNEEARELVREGGASSTEVRMDQYGRPRLIVARYP